MPLIEASAHAFHAAMGAAAGRQVVEPKWFKIIQAYVLASITLFSCWILAYLALFGVQSSFERILRGIARRTTLRMANRLAEFAARIDGASAYLYARFFRGIGPGTPDEPDRSHARVFRRSTRWCVTLLSTPLYLMALAYGFMRIAVRLSWINIILWISVLWHYGVLGRAATRASFHQLRNVQPSQFVALSVVLVIIVSLLGKSDIRGRTEFNKYASVECRKCLVRILQNIQLIVARFNELEQAVSRELGNFPRADYLERRTGFHGLAWMHGKLIVDVDCTSRRMHPAFRNRSGFDGGSWNIGRAPRTSPGRRSSNDDVGVLLSAIEQELKQLRRDGCYAHLRTILPASACITLSFLERIPAIFVPRDDASEILAPIAGESRASHWELAMAQTHGMSFENFQKVVARAVRRDYYDVRDMLWEQLVSMHKLAFLARNIQKINREVVVDRLKV